MGNKLTLDEVVKSGGNIKLGKQGNPLVDTYACKILGLLADAPSQEVRRRALEKARRMLGIR